MSDEDDKNKVSREDRSEGDFGGDQGRELTQEDFNKDAYRRSRR